MKSIAKILTNLTGIITFIVLVSHSAVYTQDKLEGVSVVNIECRIIACDTSFLKDAGIKTKGRSTIINDKAVEDMLRLLKGGKGEAIANYKLALFNEKKDNISLLKQIAYVSDYEDAIDPIIDVINEGIVVEMCPNISNDRKYINLEVSTEIREIKTFTKYPVQVLGEEREIEIPFVILQRYGSTIKIPDRGSLLITGFENTLSDRKNDSKKELLILLKATIFEPEEEIK